MATKQEQEHVVTKENPLEPLELILRCRTCGTTYATLSSHNARSTDIWREHRAHCAAAHGWEPLA